MTSIAKDAQEERRDQRIDIRLRTREKNMLERAAFYSGQSLSDFIRATLLERARMIVEENERFEFREEMREKFFEAMEEPGKASPALQAAVRDYVAKTKSRD